MKTLNYLSGLFALLIGAEVCAETSNDPDVPTTPLAYVSQVAPTTGFTIDGDLQDWATLRSLGYDNETLSGTGIKADFVEGFIAHDNNHLYVAYENTQAIDTSKWWAWQVYFDTDETSATGFAVNDRIGAEYMLQGSGVYQYTGTGSDWSWQYITSSESAVSGAFAELKISRLALGFPEKLTVMFKTRNVAFTGDYDPAGMDSYPKQFKALALHDDLLFAQHAIWNEASGIVPMTLAAPASLGDTTLVTTQAYAVLENQLLTVLAEDGEYYSAQVASSDGVTITLAQPLKVSVAAGQTLWNFYGDGAHPNLYGYHAMADFALRSLDPTTLAAASHVLIGDSWFDGNGSEFDDRLAQRLGTSNIVNRAVGGSTSQTVLERFDSDLANQTPDYIWLMVGINDTVTAVEPTDYLENIAAIIRKIRAIGALPIVFDAQVAPLFFGSDSRTQLTHQYAAGLTGIEDRLHYQLTETAPPPENDPVSNIQTITVDGDLADWSDLESFGQDPDDITQAGSKADILEAWMAHDAENFYVAYQNDDPVDTQLFWPWQVYLDTDKQLGTGYQIGNDIGANFVIQGNALFSYIGTGYDWAWQFEGVAESAVVNDVVELKFSRADIGSPDSLSTVFKARNGIFTTIYGPDSIDSFPDLDQGHFNYEFAAPEIPPVQ